MAVYQPGAVFPAFPYLAAELGACGIRPARRTCSALTACLHSDVPRARPAFFLRSFGHLLDRLVSALCSVLILNSFV